MEIRTRGGVIEATEQSADLRTPASGREAAAFAEEIKLRNAGFAAMAEELDDSGNRVGAVQGAFRAMHHFDFVDVIERRVGKIEETARLVERRAVDQKFGEVEEKRGETALTSSAGDGGAGHCGERVGKRHELAPIDFLTGDHVYGSRSLAEFQGLRISSDDYVFGELRNVEAQVEFPRLTWDKLNCQIARHKGGIFKADAVSARQKRQSIASFGRGRSQGCLRGIRFFTSSYYSDGYDAIAGSVSNLSGELCTR